MVPVTAWTRRVKQPRGGYLPIKAMHVQMFDDGVELSEKENISAGTVGTAVDYLSRVLAGGDVREVFALPIAGAEKLGKAYLASKYIAAISMFADDVDICPELISAGVNLSRYDAVMKSGTDKYVNALNGEVNIDMQTSENIAVMLQRIMAFRRRHGLETAQSKYVRYKLFSGVTGADCLSGEMDVLGQASIWDCKALNSALRATYSLQLLAYYVMLCYDAGTDVNAMLSCGFYNPISKQPGDFTLGFFNPRTNTEHHILASEIKPEVFKLLQADMVNTAYMY